MLSGTGTMDERKGLAYTRAYCEENIWKLCDARRGTDYDVVFVSNEQKSVPFWDPQSDAKLVVWDYHVFAVHRESCLVYDFDFSQFPCPFPVYRDTCLRHGELLRERYRRMYRVMPSKVYLERFSSDRSHMLDANGKYMSPPPPYAPIIPEPHNLDKMWDMTRGSNADLGDIMDQDEFVRRYERP